MNILETTRQIENILKRIPNVWDGKTAILEMKKSGYRHWKQMEWI